MLKPNRINYFFVLLIVCFISVKKTDARINASIDNFKLICGSQGSGPMDITFNNSNSQKIALIYINNKPNECTFSKNGSIYSIINTRKSGCSVQDPTSPYFSFHAIVFLQEDRWFQLATDPKFLLSCVYTGGDVKVRTAPLNVMDTTWNVQDSRWNVVRGYVDMSYQLGIYEDDGIYKRPILQAQFGQKIALKVSMSGTDQDEQGIRVRECVARSGGIEAQFINNYCSSSTILPQHAGFVSNGTEALLIGLEAFRLAGSEDLTVTFECLVDVCAYICNDVYYDPHQMLNETNYAYIASAKIPQSGEHLTEGLNVMGFGNQRMAQNCHSHQRVKRDSPLKQNTSQVQAFGKVKVLGIDQYYTGPDKHWCLNQLEFIVPITYLSCFLCLILIILICILTCRQKKHKEAPKNTE